MFFKTGVLKSFRIFTGKNFYWSLLLNKIAAHNACHFIKKRLQRRYFPVKFVKILRTAFFKKMDSHSVYRNVL